MGAGVSSEGVGGGGWIGAQYVVGRGGGMVAHPRLGESLGCAVRSFGGGSVSHDAGNPSGR